MTNQTDDGFTEAKGGTDSTWDRKDPIMGVYTRQEDNVGPNESTMYHIKTDTEVVGVWGSTVLDTKFSEVPVGSIVKIESLGLKKNPKSGREYADFSLKYKKPVSEAVEDTFPGSEAV